MKRYLFGMVLILMILSLSTANSFGEQDEPLIPASRIIDQDVYGSTGKIIGEVEDFVVKRSGRIKRLIVEYGGFYDIADRLVGVPFKMTHMQKGHVMIETTKKRLDRKPTFDYSRKGLLTQFYYYSNPPRPYPSTSYYYDPTLRRERQLPMENLAFSPSRFLASVITNRRMINEQGRDIGWIDDLLVNVEENKVEKIIISVEYVLGGGVSKLALPYKPLGFTGYGLVYDISLLNLKNMPEYITQETDKK